jgi:hypothetical protein
VNVVEATATNVLEFSTRLLPPPVDRASFSRSRTKDPMQSHAGKKIGTERAFTHFVGIEQGFLLDAIFVDPCFRA